MKKILLISHEAITRSLMAMLIDTIKSYNIEISEALSCSDGILRLREDRFDLVITDNRTGADEKTGFDVVREVHGKRDGSKVIVAAYRLTDAESEIGRVLTPNAFLQKPFDSSLFTFMVADLLENYE